METLADNGFSRVREGVTTLEEVVNFYNTRDKAGAKWPPPEVKANVNTEELGDLGLTPEEEAAIVTFMKTLSDGGSLPGAKLLKKFDQNF